MIELCEAAPAWVRNIAPYVPGKPSSELAREMGLDEKHIVKLASNENPLGPSPKAKEAMRAALDDMARYPDGNGFELKQALAARYGVEMSRIVLGNGSNDVLELAGRTFLSPGTSGVYSQHAFAVYPLTVQSIGAAHIQVPARDFGHDLDAMAAAIRDDTRVVFIANPNNPTGTFVGGAALRQFLAKVPRRVLVVLDEAYTEYLPDADRYDSISWLQEFPNLLVSRTFSKAFGLAGLRVGYGFAHPDVADLMNRVRQPFNVNALAQAGAVASLTDAAYLAQSRAINGDGMKQVIDGVTRLGVSHIPSRGNFVCVHAGKGGEIYQSLLREGVIVRPIGGYGMPEWLRVSIGLPEENERFLSAFSRVLGGAARHR
ncbi:MAG: histidinol-phosphate transaminase [Burkholderiales bacterium]